VKKLQLGCGNDPLTGPDVVNHDRMKHRPEVDIVHDLDILPWPWSGNSFDLIVARSVFEHLRLNLIESLNECWRILRPGGQIFIKLPHWQSDISHDDPTHRWYFSLRSLDQFDPDTPRGKDYGFYTDRKWRIVQAPELNKAKSSILATLEVRK
jgi:SAM-dependent methyltransferase